MNSTTIREVAVIPVDPSVNLRPGDTGILREIGGYHDYLSDKLVEVSTDITTALMAARMEYYNHDQHDAKPVSRMREQVFTSMLTGLSYVIV